MTNDRQWELAGSMFGEHVAMKCGGKNDVPYKNGGKTYNRRPMKEEYHSATSATDATQQDSPINGMNVIVLPNCSYYWVKAIMFRGERPVLATK
jgi:hypothetical protein